MTYLKTDEQTISDLGIFGIAGKPSVYTLYNNTITQGGGARMEELFRKPITDHEIINQRAARYRFFSERTYQFPIESETMAALAYYLENDDVRTQLQLGSQSIGQRFKDIVATDAERVFVNDGVQAALRLFYRVDQFLQQLKMTIEKSVCEELFTHLHELIHASEFSQINPYLSPKFEVKLSVVQLSELDKLIRFEQREKVFSILGLLYDLDVLIAVGSVARKNNFHFATAFPENNNTISYQQVYHPHVLGAIANNLELDKMHNILFLTGANMAGKSTLMKSVGIALYMAHMGFPVAAKSFAFAVRDGIYTSINLADNLNAGASHYYAEVLRVKEVAKELREGKHLFVIFDELFRGTNVKDAFDATVALTSAFANKRSSQFIISTHIMEAGEVLQQKQLPIKYQYLPTEMSGNTPVYTRVLRDGITADRQGMVIIQNEGILEMLDAGLSVQNKIMNNVICN